MGGNHGCDRNSITVFLKDAIRTRIQSRGNCELIKKYQVLHYMRPTVQTGEKSVSMQKPDGFY